MRQEVTALKEALEARKVIERAKGIVMNKLHIAEDDAYRILQKYSRDQNLKLKEVAQSVVAANGLFSSNVFADRPGKPACPSAKTMGGRTNTPYRQECSQ